MKRCGLIGLGNMGASIGRHLVRASPLNVCDTDATRSALLNELGAQVFATPKAIAEQSDVVFLSLPTPEAVEEVLTGEAGVFRASPPFTIVDLSTTGPALTVRMAAISDERGIEYLDAPVSGGSTGAAAASLTIIAAGRTETFNNIKPLLATFSARQFLIGPDPGQGQMMKLVNNMLISACAVASFEVLVLGAKAGLDAERMLEVINVSSGRNWVTMEKVSGSILDRNFPPGFATELLLKDVKLGLSEAEHYGATMSVVSRVRDFLTFAVSQGDGPSDYATIIRHLEHWAGTEVSRGGSTAT